MHELITIWGYHFNPGPPSAPTDIVVGHCVRPAGRLPVCSSVRPERRSRSNSLGFLAISLKFSGKMHSTIKQIAIYNDHAWPIFARSMELWNFQNSFFTRSEGRLDRSDSLRISAIGLQFGGMMQSNMKQITI